MLATDKIGLNRKSVVIARPNTIENNCLCSLNRGLFIISIGLTSVTLLLILLTFITQSTYNIT